MRDGTLSVPSSMAEIFVVGSACGFPVSGRGHSSLLLSVLDRSVLIDAGEPCSRSLIEAEFPVNSIDAVLLTHGHADHTGGLPMLIQSLWLSQRKSPLTIFLPEELSKPLQLWLDAIYLGPAFMPFEFRCLGNATILRRVWIENLPAGNDSSAISVREIRISQVQIVQSSGRAFRFSPCAFGRSWLADRFGVTTWRSCGPAGQRTCTFSATRTVSVSRYTKSAEASTHSFCARIARQPGISHSGREAGFARNIGDPGERRASSVVLAPRNQAKTDPTSSLLARKSRSQEFRSCRVVASGWGLETSDTALRPCAKIETSARLQGLQPRLCHGEPTVTRSLSRNWWWKLLSGNELEVE